MANNISHSQCEPTAVDAVARDAEGESEAGSFMQAEMVRDQRIN
jgi:hypothetical protein